MKAKFQGTIKRINKCDTTFNVIGSPDMVELELSLKGRVQDAAVSAKDTEMHAFLKLKPLVANELKIGANITVTVTDEEELSKE